MKKLLIFALMLLPIALASCGDDKNEPKTNTTSDPDGTVIVNVSRDESAYAVGVEIILADNYNLRCFGGSISVVGPVKSIGNITATAASVQNLTWTAEAAAEVKYGYIFRVNRGYERINGEYVYYYDHYAVYVDSEIGSTSGGVLGYKLKVRKLLEKIPSQN